MRTSGALLPWDLMKHSSSVHRGIFLIVICHGFFLNVDSQICGLKEANVGTLLRQAVGRGFGKSDFFNLSRAAVDYFNWKVYITAAVALVLE